MKKTSIIKYIMWFFAVLPLFTVLFLYNKLPEQIPSHWGIYGDVSYSNKSTLWFISALPVILTVLFIFLPKIDPKKKNYLNFEMFYYSFAAAIMIFLDAIILMVISESFNPGKLNVPAIVVSAIGLLFVFIGFMMPKFKSNFFIGIRNPWTISDNEVWDKTHLYAKKLWIFGGLLNIIISFFLKENILFIAFIIILIVITIIPNVYSYILFKKNNKN